MLVKRFRDHRKQKTTIEWRSAFIRSIIWNTTSFRFPPLLRSITTFQALFFTNWIFLNLKRNTIHSFLNTITVCRGSLVARCTPLLGMGTTHATSFFLSNTVFLVVDRFSSHQSSPPSKQNRTKKRTKTCTEKIRGRRAEELGNGCMTVCPTPHATPIVINSRSRYSILNIFSKRPRLCRCHPV